VSAALRLPRAFASPFWQDEVASARILREPTFPGMLRHVALTESTPPLWYAAAWSLHHAGVSIHDTRLLSVAANGALVAGVYLLGRRVLGRRGALAASVLVAVGGEFSAQGRWIRAYELFALVVVVFALAVLAAVRQPTATRLGAVALTAGAGALTHYFFAFTALAAIAWLSFDPAARAARSRALGAICAGLLPFTLWVPAFLDQFHQHRYSWIGRFSLTRVVETPLRLFTPLATGAWATVAGVAVLLGCGAGASVVWRRVPAGRLCVALGLLPLALAASVWAVGERVYAVRNMIAIGPFLAITAVAALGSLPRRLGGVAPVALVALAVAGFAWDQRATDTPFKTIAGALVADGWRSGDAVAVYGNLDAFRSPLGWYLPRTPNLTHVSRPQAFGPVVYVLGGRRELAALGGREARRAGSMFVVRLRRLRLRTREKLLQGAAVLTAAPSPGSQASRAAGAR
jgi:hypothetical protein